jgi:hypothetical protein
MRASVRPSVHASAVRKAKPRDWLVRFAFGGAISVGTGLIAHFWGPSVGGLFLAFPAILPATLTLAKQRDGRAEATEDARGGSLGAVALVAFGAVACGLLPTLPAGLALPLALVAWLAAGVGLWWTVYA